ncbi:hypothetical protein FOA52_002268 [Chlamydomonas sp. UWO 241]|nr:hypothetical protein FOA52_002268 [Chlamydomonas sp. UWO 241]
MPSSAPRLSWLVSVLLVLCDVSLPAAAQPSAGSPASGNGISTNCIAALVRDVLAATSTNVSAEEKYSDVSRVVNSFVESCTHGFEGSSTGLRPLRILGVTGAAAAEFAQLTSDFQLNTGYKVIFEPVAYTDVVRELEFVEPTSPLVYDGWLADGSMVVELAIHTKMTAPLDSFVARDSRLQWSDVTEYVREISSTYGGATVGVPLSGRPLALMYREDVLDAANLTTPNTWEDMVTAVKILNGTDFNGDDVSDFSLCWELSDCAWHGTIAVSAVLATMTQTAGPQTGFLWDPDTMAALGGTAAMTRTMELIQQLLPYTATSCAPINPNFMRGDCAITIASEALFKGFSMYTPFKSLIGTALVPGSKIALNRQTGGLEACTPALCPHAVRERTYDGTEVLVNRAPHFGIGGFSGFVNAYQDEEHQQAMFSFFSFASEPVYSKHLVMTSMAVGVYRKSHLDTNAQSLAAWRALGYDDAAVKEYLTTVAVALEHPNFVMDLRMLNGERFLGTLYTALLNASAGMAPAEIAANVLVEQTAILASSGALDVVRQSLRAGLGISVASPPPPPPTPVVVVVSQRGKSETNVAIILGVTIPLAVMLTALLIAVLVVRKNRRRSMFGGHLVPPPGEDTTLVVTDIMDSTVLWETLGPGVMECAIATHNAIVRLALVKWSGYEQTTEGDSFLLAFHTPSDALGFAMQLQANLLEAAWEPELLQHPFCAPVTMGPSAALLATREVKEDDDPDPTSACQLGNARELVQSLHAAAAAATGDEPLIMVESATSLDSPARRGAAPAASTMAKFMRLAWTSEGSPAAAAAAGKSVVTVFKGLRVRIGMHSGVEKVDVELNATAGRVFFTGVPLALTKAIGDAGAGGMVLMTKETFVCLHLDRALKDMGVLVLSMGKHTFTDDTLRGCLCVYQAIERQLVPRLAVFEPLRGLSELQPGAMDAPIGTVCIAFANMVGLATLQAWDKDRADVALDAYAAVLKQLLHDAGGYLVDLTASGQCLVAFHHPLDAVAWGAGLIEVMKHRQWDEELLSHELCEEVLLHEPGGEYTGGSSPLSRRVLLRGPRIKIGIDVGKVQADVAPLTGRMSYHGKVMNRAARISSKASSGKQWCSATVWEKANGLLGGARLLTAGIRGTQLGAFSLKGVTRRVELVECSWRHGDDAAGGSHDPSSSAGSRPITLGTGRETS